MYVVIGANGFLGSYILKNILDITDEKIIATARNVDKQVSTERVRWEKCSVENREDVDQLCDMLEQYDDLKIIYLAAYHHPDKVQKNPRIAWNINITALSYFINRINNVKCFFYPSTDTVYGEGDSDILFLEESSLKPVNQYGVQKMTAESVVLGYGYNVVRYPFLIAPSLATEKKHFYDVIVETISAGRKMEMFADSYRSSLDFNTAAELLVKLIVRYDSTIPKVLNLAGDQKLSKYDVGLMIADKIGVDRSLIVPIRTDESEGIFEAKRAKSTLIDNSKVKEILGIEEIHLIL